MNQHEMEVHVLHNRAIPSKSMVYYNLDTICAASY